MYDLNKGLMRRYSMLSLKRNKSKRKERSTSRHGYVAFKGPVSGFVLFVTTSFLHGYGYQIFFTFLIEPSFIVPYEIIFTLYKFIYNQIA